MELFGIKRLPASFKKIIDYDCVYYECKSTTAAIDGYGWYEFKQGHKMKRQRMKEIHPMVAAVYVKRWVLRLPLSLLMIDKLVGFG